MVREVTEKDLNNLLSLYTQLHENPFPAETEQLTQLWKKIINDPDHHIIVAEKDGLIVSSCVLVVVPNLTHCQRPYALVENVITDESHRKQGYATMCLNNAKMIAQEKQCYKIMLLTGSKEESTLYFYEQAGYNKNDKIAFVQWL